MPPLPRAYCQYCRKETGVVAPEKPPPRSGFVCKECGNPIPGLNFEQDSGAASLATTLITGFFAGVFIGGPLLALVYWVFNKGHLSLQGYLISDALGIALGLIAALLPRFRKNPRR